MNVGRAWRALSANKQFVAFFLVVVVALTVAAGTPGKRFVAGASRTVTTPTTAPALLPTLEPVGLPEVIAEPPAELPPPSPDTGGDLSLPPADPPPPPKVCSTDAVTALNDQLRGSLVEALGQPLPGKSLNTLVQLAAGCSDVDPTTAVLDVALDVAKALPNLGLPFIDIPDLPAIPPLPAETLAPLLAPLADPIKQGCSQLATVALVLVVAPPAFQVPLSQSDIIQFLAPASAFCALFDETPA